MGVTNEEFAALLAYSCRVSNCSCRRIICGSQVAKRLFESSGSVPEFDITELCGVELGLDGIGQSGGYQC
jgi:hypothetical protein